MKSVILSAVGHDRPGIVADVTRVLYETGCNLEDSSMTRLEGEFAVLLIVTVPPSVSLDDLDRRFKALVGLTVHLKEVDTPASPGLVRSWQEGVWIISIYGADKPGIVYRVAEALAQLQINVTDLQTHRSEGPTPLYQLVLEVELPTDVTATQLETRMKQLAASLGVDVSVRAMEAVEL